MDSALSTSSPLLRVVIFPWLAFGHLHPYLELAERLALQGHRVSFISTPGNISRLPPLRSATAPLIDFVALPLPRVDGLPVGVESTNSVTADKFGILFQAFDGLAAPFTEFLGAACVDAGGRPDWVIVDSFHHWAAAAADEFKVPCVMLTPTAAFLVARERPETMPRYEREQMAGFRAKRSASEMPLDERFSLTLAKCTIAATQCCVELEAEAFTLAASLLPKPLVPLGLMPPARDGGRSGGADLKGGEDAVVRWLDAQPPSSVVYVALGSEVPLPTEQVHELALGLDLAGTRFLWALRKPHGGTLDTVADILPPGFQDRTRNQGLVTTGWVPQLSVLAHGAVGAFLTHCGRNSITEGLMFGRPLIMLPVGGDQGPNARLMETKKVGLQVPRDENDGSFSRQGVASTVQAVMLAGEKRDVFVENAQKAQGIVADEQLHERYIDEFVKKLRFYGAEYYNRIIALT